MLFTIQNLIQKSGDKVRIKQTVPISKTKTWAVASILKNLQLKFYK